MTTLTAAPVKEIKYNRLTKDYDMLLNGEYVGSRASYHAAEIELDRLAYERLDRAGVEPELTLSATALDGVCSCGAVFNEYGQCEVCAERKDAPAILVTDPIHPYYGMVISQTRVDGPYHIGYRDGGVWGSLHTSQCQTITPDDTPADDHNLVTPDPAECPSTTEPQPVEDCPACATPDDDEPADDDENDDWPDGLDEVLAPSWPVSSSSAPCFILPTGTTAQSIILCVGGVSRVVSAAEVARALTLASVHPQSRPARTANTSDPFDDPRTDEERRWETEGWTECEGGWEKFGPHPFDASRTVRHFRRRV